MDKKDVIEKIGNIMQEVFDENQKRSNQYVVAYHKVSDDSLVGYHLDTFCQLTNDILKAKRYSGVNPYDQLKAIAKTLKFTLDTEKHEGVFSSINNSVKEGFKGLLSKDIYMDAVYLAEGTPKQEFRYTFINNEKKG